MTLSHFISLVIPNYFGNPSTYNYWEKLDYIETSVSAGLIPCLFAVFGLVNFKNKHATFKKIYIATLIITLLFALDWFVIKFIYELHIPLLSIGVPTRVFFLTTFSIAVLAGFGYEYVCNINDKNRKFLKIISVFILAVSILLAITVYNMISNASCPDIMKNCRITSLRNTGLEVVGFMTAAIFLTMRKFRFGVIAIFLVYILGFYNSYKFLPFSSKETFFPENQTIKAIKNIAGNARIFGLEDANIPTDFATEFKFYDPNYYHPFYIKRYGELVNYANKEEYPPQMLRSSVELVNQELLSERKEFLRNRLYSLLNINYLLFKKNGSLAKEHDSSNRIVWENDKLYLKERVNKTARVFIVQKIEAAKNGKDELKRLFSASFDPATTAILEQTIDLKIDKNRTTNQKDNAIIKDYRENKVIIETKTSTDSLLVLTDNYYPGWRAYVGNKEVPIFRTNYTFRSVKIPSGVHLVSFIYDPISFSFGLWTSLGSIVFYVILLFLSVFYAKIRL